MFTDGGNELVAVCILGGLAVVLVVTGVRAYRRMRYTWAQLPFYLLYIIYTRIVWRATISRPLPVEPGEGAIVVSNHVSSIDPAFIQLGTDKVVHWMVAREYSHNPWMAWIFRITESIPVNRSGVDTAATKMAIRYVRQGDVVGIFPEGKINMTDKLLLPGRPGAALIALKCRVPVIPCYIADAPFDGTEFGCMLMTAQTRCIVGDPIDLSGYYDREHSRQVLGEVTKRFLVEIARLAGHDDFEPELAGRSWKGPSAESTNGEPMHRGDAVASEEVEG